MPDPIDPINPNVTPAPLWQWSAFASTVLVMLEQVLPDILAIPNPPRWVAIVAAALPWVIRFGRIWITKQAVSFRRVP